MFKFGKYDLGGLDRFGISGLFDRKIEVFYEVLFSTRHLGRVSDLLAARLRSSQVDPLRLRSTLLFGVFHAHRSQFKRKGIRIFSRDDEDALEEPLLIECGIDDEKVGIGILFNLNIAVPFNAQGLGQRIFKKEAQGGFEEFLVQLQDSADRMILKFHPPTRRVEVLLLLALPGKIDYAHNKQPPEVLVLTSTEIPTTPRPKVYTYLGDLDYPKLLQEEARAKKKLDSPTGEFLLPKDDSKDQNEVLLKIKPYVELPADEDGLTGESRHRREIVSALQSLKSSSQKQDEVISIKGGGGGDLLDHEKMVVSGGDESSSGPGWGVKFGSFLLGLARKGIQRVLGNSSISGSKDLSSDNVEISSQSSWQETQFGVSGSASHSQETTQVGSGRDPAEEDIIQQEGNYEVEASDSRSKLATLGKKVEDPEAESKKLMVELKAGGLDQLIKRFQKDFPTVKKDISSAKATKWVEGLIQQLNTERAALTEYARKVNLAARLKTQELKTRVSTVEDELKRKEALLFQRNKSLNKNQELLAEANQKVEKMQAMMESGGDDQLKQKYNLTHKMLMTAKEENAQLVQKLEEMKSTLSSFKNAPGETVSLTEFSDLREKYEKLFRQAEDLKKTNRQLSEHKSDPKVEGTLTLPSSTELEKKLEAAMKLIAASRRETAELKKQVVAHQEQEAARQEEMARLQQEIIQLKSEQKPGSSA